MLLLSANGLRKSFGPEPVLSNVCLEIHRGERVGLVGPNGCGKSTLLKILARELESDGGELSIHASIRLGYLQQHADFDPHKTVWEVTEEPLQPLRALVKEAEEVAAEMARATTEADRRKLESRYDALHHELDRLDAFQIEHKVQPVLAGLGFRSDQFQQPAGQLSGGQQNRLMLARILLSDTELMILDEPSNHLDLESTRWLEDYLRDTHRTFLVVSHDRYLLDKVTQRTLELFQGTVDSYKGNYSAYQRQKAERIAIQRKTYESQRDEIARLEDFVRRNQYGQKHAQAEDRRKKLERMELVDPPREIFAPPIVFPPPARSGDIVVRAERISKGFPGAARELFQELSFDILRGERWGILGANGSGKTTLLRCILSEEPTSRGKVTLGTGVRVGYFDQQLRSLDPEALVVDAVRPRNIETIEPERRSLLARFGITGDLVFSRVGSLSGGEKTRAALARISAEQVNLLVLDEPTNHLDLWACQALEDALLAFPGTVLMVSHDRFFLNRVADHILAFHADRVWTIPGGYEDYLAFVAQREGQTSAKAEAIRPVADVERTTAKGAGSKKKRKFPYRKTDEIEKEIAAKEAEIAELESRLGDPQVLRSGVLVKQVQQSIADTRAALAILFEHWEETLS